MSAMNWLVSDKRPEIMESLSGVFEWRIGGANASVTA